MDLGFNGQTLAIFTDLAPAGAVAVLCWIAFFAVRGRSLPEEQRGLLNAVLAIPIAVCWVGFIASATHLGTPANALYVASGVGRSPLSNEVAAAVAFLLFTGVYWLYSFRRGYSRALGSALLVCVGVSAVMLLHFTSMAYDVASVPSWSTPYSQANLLLTGLFSGCALGGLTLFASHADTRRWPQALVVCSAVALVAGSVVLWSHMGFLAGLNNNVANALDQVRYYPFAIVGHGVLGAAGLALQLWGQSLRVASRRRALVIASVGCLFVLVAALLVRLPFYDAYLSIGF